MHRLSVFGPSDILRVLHGFNPWWTGRKLALPSFRRAVLAACKSHVAGTNSQRCVMLLSGMRGAGKTTMLYQLAEDLVAGGMDPRAIVYLSCEHPIFSTVPVARILEAHREATGLGDAQAVLLLDEVHCARDWDSQVKGLFGEDGQGYRIVATESVETIERALLTETQFDRWWSVQVPSVSYFEYLRMHGADPLAKANVPSVADLHKLPIEDLRRLCTALAQADVRQFRRYLYSGGLPALAATSADGAGPLLHDLIAERAFRRDASVQVEPRNLDELKRLFLYLCLHSGEIFPVQRYANLVGISPSTVSSHLAVLEQCFLVRKIPPTDETGEESNKPRYKFVIADSSLRAAALLDDGSADAAPAETHTAYVTCLARHVMRRYGGAHKIGYWHDPRSLRDVDLVVHGKGGLLAFQTVEGASVTSKDPAVALCRRAHVPGVLLACPAGTEPGHARIEGLPTVFVRLPTSVLAYLLGREEAAAWRG
ncbi:MAG: hypothetical protein HMLKMBBP_00230 [Planctomycetes bacterium]|nr:hypothetical protein [Planctomycetota bacterium]